MIDAQLVFSSAQGVTAAAASTNYIDLSVARDFARGEALGVYINVTVAMTDSGSDSTLSVYVYYDSTTTFTPDASQLGLIIPAVSAIGANFYFNLDPQISTLYQYAELYYSPNNGNLTTGTFDAALVWGGTPKWTPYSSGSTITT